MTLRNYNLIGPMGGAASVGDNVAMESFFALLQKNVLNKRYRNAREELRLAGVTLIERTYHRRRRQRGLGKPIPIEFETIYTQTANAPYRPGRKITMGEFIEKMKDLKSRVVMKQDAHIRVLEKKPNSKSLGHSARRLNKLASGMQFCHSYLEIGVAQGLTLEQVRVKERVGVDPHPQFDVSQLPKGVSFNQMESDQYFETVNRRAPYDLVFLDGLHVWSQTYKDLINAIHICQPTSIILIDDVVPDDELSAYPDWAAALALKDAAGFTDGRWHGDVFKVILAIQRFHPELSFCVVGKRDRSDNPQAIIWFSTGAEPGKLQPATKMQLLEIEKLTYKEVFKEEQLPYV